MDFTYYADLNPRYGARYERRYAVFLRRSATETSQTNLHYATLKAAENAARKLIEQEADPEVTNHPNRSQAKTFTIALGPLPKRVELHSALEALTEEIWARGYTPNRREKLNIEQDRGVVSVNFTVRED